MGRSTEQVVLSPILKVSPVLEKGGFRKPWPKRNGKSSHPIIFVEPKAVTELKASEEPDILELQALEERINGVLLQDQSSLPNRESEEDVCRFYYFNELNRVPHLTKEEKEALGRTITRRKILPTATDIISKEKPVISGETAKYAKQRLTESCLRLVVSLAGQYSRPNLDFMELVQAGNMGLAEAAERYDYTKGCAFSTYAFWWIRKYINISIAEQLQPIKLFEGMQDAVRTYKSKTAQLIKEGHMPTDERLAEEMGTSVKQLGKVKRAQQIQPRSLNVKVGENKNVEFGDTIKDEDPGVEETAVDKVAGEEIRGQMTALIYGLVAQNLFSEKQAETIFLRFGLKDGVPKTQNETGKILGVTKQAVSLWEIKAMKVLRSPEVRAQFAEFQ